METVVCGYRGCQVTWWRPYKNTLLKLYLGVAWPKYDTLDFLMLYIFLCLFPISIWFWSCQRHWAMTSSLKMGRPVIECEPDGMQISASKSVGSQLAKDRVIAPSGGVYLSWGLVKTCSVAVIQMPYLSVCGEERVQADLLVDQCSHLHLLSHTLGNDQESYLIVDTSGGNEFPLKGGRAHPNLWIIFLRQIYVETYTTTGTPF